MKYNFDEIIDRRQTGSSKWDNTLKRIGRTNVIPMWTADTDFRCPYPVTEAVIARAQHPIYGYPFEEDRFKEATAAWMERRHAWKISTDWVVLTSGVVPVFHTSLQAFTQPGDRVLIQTPVYHSFAHAIQDNERVPVECPLHYGNGKYTMDFDRLEQEAKVDGTKMMFLCSPHNPVGRVWTKEELIRVEEICLAHNLLLLVDEIHSDLILHGHLHHSLASLDERYLENTINCFAPSKTFNTAGLRCAGIIVPNMQLRAKLKERFLRNKATMQNIFAIPSYAAAYTECDDYVEQLIEYLEGNYAYAKEMIAAQMPDIHLVEAEATFLIWLDCRALGLSDDALADFFYDEAGIGIVRGDVFGTGGEGFARINIGCPRSTLEKAMNQLAAAYRRRKAELSK